MIFVEVIGALAAALVVFWLVFRPLLVPPGPELSLHEPEAPEESRRGVALRYQEQPAGIE